MGKIVDLSNKKFGMLTVISYVYSKNRHAYWLCKCECGKSKITNSSQLRSPKCQNVWFDKKNRVLGTSLR